MPRFRYERHSAVTTRRFSSRTLRNGQLRERRQLDQRNDRGLRGLGQRGFGHVARELLSLVLGAEDRKALGLREMLGGLLGVTLVAQRLPELKMDGAQRGRIRTLLLGQLRATASANRRLRRPARSR